jgi:hypothetical protein
MFSLIVFLFVPRSSWSFEISVNCNVTFCIVSRRGFISVYGVIRVTTMRIKLLFVGREGWWKPNHWKLLGSARTIKHYDSGALELRSHMLTRELRVVCKETQTVRVMRIHAFGQGGPHRKKNTCSLKKLYGFSWECSAVNVRSNLGLGNVKIL